MTKAAPHYKLLRCAFEDTISALGELDRKAIIEDLESRGAYHDERYIDLFEVCESLERYFGVTSPDIIVCRVWMKLNRLCSVGTLPQSSLVTLA